MEKLLLKNLSNPIWVWFSDHKHYLFSSILSSCWGLTYLQLGKQTKGLRFWIQWSVHKEYNEQEEK